jgi:type VI secretion system secreted protein VgrG
MADETRVFHFHSDAVPDDTFQTGALKGVEELSAPYAFEIQLASKKADIAFDKMLNSPAWISVRQAVPVSGGKYGTKIQKIHGLLSSFDLIEQVQEFVKYRATLVPRLWKCSLTTQCRVFQDMDIKDLIKAILTEKGGSGLTTKDFDLKLNASYSKREFVVQYNETDLDFLHRWLEHEGIYYFFEQTESGEKLIFSDGTAAYAKLPGDPKIPYRPDPASRSRSGGSDAEESLQEQTVHSFLCRVTKTTKQVVLKDHNYRTPSVDVKGKGESKNPAAEGLFYAFGEHFKTADEGNALAKLRAEAIACRDKMFLGVSDHRSFRVGATFGLSEHFRADFNASYLLTRIEHDMTQATAAGGKGGSMNYKNTFDCIPADVVFRPLRRTEWPSIHGFVNATIDGAGSNQYAEIDDHGRYKVKLPFDLSDKKDGKASRYIRMMQPYAGGGMGMHFPLHKGTEVALGFVDGDPDRPIILGALVNPETASPVSGANQTQSKIHTGGGNSFTIEDTAGTQSMVMHTPSGNTSISIGKS